MKDKDKGNKFIGFRSFRLSLELFGLWGSLDVKKRELYL
jgi:hypothetical protein